MEYLVFMLILSTLILYLVSIYLKLLINDINCRISDLIDILDKED